MLIVGKIFWCFKLNQRRIGIEFIAFTKGLYVKRIADIERDVLKKSKISSQRGSGTKSRLLYRFLRFRQTKLRCFRPKFAFKSFPNDLYQLINLPFSLQTQKPLNFPINERKISKILEHLKSVQLCNNFYFCLLFLLHHHL